MKHSQYWTYPLNIGRFVNENSVDSKNKRKTKTKISLFFNINKKKSRIEDENLLCLKENVGGIVNSFVYCIVVVYFLWYFTKKKFYMYVLLDIFLLRLLYAMRRFPFVTINILWWSYLCHHLFSWLFKCEFLLFMYINIFLVYTQYTIYSI